MRKQHNKNTTSLIIFLTTFKNSFMLLTEYLFIEILLNLFKNNKNKYLKNIKQKQLKYITKERVR